LQQNQDRSIKRQNEVREQMKLERTAREQAENLSKQEMKVRDEKIDALSEQVGVFVRAIDLHRTSSFIQLVRRQDLHQAELNSLREKVDDTDPFDCTFN
jgi:tRNA C32,U32 (ribose-2'-O)-methylase TrmJ